MKNYYEILEVNKKASKEVIEKAYKVLVKKYHPDLYTGQKKNYAEEKIKEINEAYSVLTDEFMKEQYDTELEKQEQVELYKKYNRKQTTNTLNDDLQSNINNANNTSNNRKANKNHKSQRNNKEEVEEFNEKMKKHKVGSFSGIIELCKELYKNKPKRDEVKEITKKDIIALILTIIIVILILVALWYIPFTNGWIRQLLFENSLFNAIAGLFK